MRYILISVDEALGSAHDHFLVVDTTINKAVCRVETAAVGGPTVNALNAVE